MAKIPQRGDPTLEALNAILEAEQQPYISKNIGFGEIGHECERYLYSKIHATEPEVFSADTLKIFRGGHSDEALMAADLRKVPGIELHTHDPNRDNKQYKLDSLGGRFTGRLDGVILGIRQAPKAWHTWEHKSCSDKIFDALLKLIDKFGEKDALREWNIKYYAQAQSNMYHAELDRCYMTIGTPGLRRVTSIRTELNKEYAEYLKGKAKRVIEARSPPEKIGGPDYWTCKNCRFYFDCHGGKNA